MFGKHKAALWLWKDAVLERFERLRLTIHAHAQPRPVKEGIPFLGFIVAPHRPRMKQRKGMHFRRKLRAQAAAVQDGHVTIEKLTASVRGWINHASHANTFGLRKAVLGELRVSPLRPVDMAKPTVAGKLRSP